MQALQPPKTAYTMMDRTSARRLAERRRPRLLTGLALAGVLCVGCDTDVRLPTAPRPPEFGSFNRSLSLVSGNGQQGRVGEQLSRAFVVRVTDARGRPENDATVLFRVIEGGGEIPGERVLINGEPGAATTAVTDAAGIARVFLVLGPRPGLNLVETKIFFGGSNAVYFSATADP